MVDIATILEKVANYLDAIDANQERQIRESREKLAELFKEKYESVTGDIFTDDMYAKLARADVDILEAFNNLTEISATKVAELGASGGQLANVGELSTKEAAKYAADKFAEFLIS